MYIFGYGSLVDITKLQIYLEKESSFTPDELKICKLKKHRRVWNVAMDNHITLENYKYYLEGDIRPNYFVTFLNIEKSKNSEVLGVLFKVDKEMLEKLHLRERNYQLIEITSNLDIKIDEKAYTFIAKDESIDRFNSGIKNLKCVISKEYFDFILNSFQILEKNKEKWSKYFIKEYKENFVESFLKSSFRDTNIRFKNLKKIPT